MRRATAPASVIDRASRSGQPYRVAVIDEAWHWSGSSFTAASPAPAHGHLSSPDVCPERLGGPDH